MIDLKKMTDDELVDLYPALEEEFSRRRLGRPISAEATAKAGLALEEIVIAAAAGIMQASLVASGSEDPDGEIGRMIDAVVGATGRPDTLGKCRILLVAAIEAVSPRLGIRVEKGVQ
jgi:hypothetical protein